jgi:hypothetical protein
MVVGTPEFMSPEQATGGDEPGGVDARSDLFSLGSVLYAACSGVSPFRADSPFLTLDRVRHKAVPALTVIDPTIPEWFAAVVQRLLVKDPVERIASAAELADTLEGTNAGLPTLTLQETTTRALALASPTRPSRRRWWAAGIVGLFGVATAAVIYANLDRPQKDRAAPQPGATEQLGPNVAELKPAPRVGFLIVGKDQIYPALAEAVIAARDGDTIEIHGDGPFPTPPIHTADKRLVIRAAVGSRPGFFPDAPNRAPSEPFVSADADLELDGLDVRWTIDPQLLKRPPRSEAENISVCAIVCTRGRLTVTRCRVAVGPFNTCAGASGREMVLTGCHLLADNRANVFWSPAPGGRLSVEGCMIEGRVAVSVLTSAETLNPPAATVLLTGNTFASHRALQLLPDTRPKERINITARRNVFANDQIVFAFGLRNPKNPESPLPEEVTNPVQSFVRWSDEANLYRRGCSYLVCTVAQRPGVMHSAGIEGLVAWLKLWDQSSTRSVEGAIRFRERPKSATAQPLRLDRVDDPSGTVPDKVGADPDRVGPR